VFKSTDGGNRWKYQVFSPDYSYCLAVDPRDPDILYSGYQKKVFEEGSAVYRNRKNTEEWDALLSVLGARAVKWVEIDPSDPDVLYAGVTGSRGSIRVSRDGGRTWKHLNDQLTFTTIWGHSQL